MAKSSSNKAFAIQIDYGKSYVIKPKTMVLGKKDLIVQVESPVEFIALKRHGVDVSSYRLTQGLNGYFGMLNGPTYEELVKEFWIKAEVYDKETAKYEEIEKINGDSSLKGKTTEEMGFPEFTITEINSAIMGIPINITEEIIALAARCSNEGKFLSNLKNKASPWIKTTYAAFHKGRTSDKFCDM